MIQQKPNVCVCVYYVHILCVPVFERARKSKVDNILITGDLSEEHTGIYCSILTIFLYSEVSQNKNLGEIPRKFRLVQTNKGFLACENDTDFSHAVFYLQ